MDFGDYIYIIIGVLWFIFSVIGGAAKAAKKKQQQSPAAKSKPAPSSADDDLQRVINELLKGSKQEVKKSPPPPPAPKKKPITTERRAPVKLETHQQHDSFMKEMKQKQEKKKTRILESRKELLSSQVESVHTTSHLQHPPVTTLAEPESGESNQLKQQIREVHPLLLDFDPRKAVIFAEIFNRKMY